MSGANPSGVPPLDPWGPAAQLADGIARKGAKVVLRRMTKTAGPTPLLNPPRVQNATLAAAVPPGATMIPISADSAVGHLLPGDILVIAGVNYPVLAEAVALPQGGGNPREPTGSAGFAGVAVAPLAAPLAAGLAVGFTFAADLNTYAMINSFPVRLVDGERIRMRDLAVTMAAYGIAEIQPTWTIFVRGREMSIEASSPNYLRDDITSWSLQAR